MELGDLITLGDRAFYVRGFDPEGVQPRYVYLEDAKTRRTIQIAFEEISRTAPNPRRGLRIVDDSAEGDPVRHDR